MRRRVTRIDVDLGARRPRTCSRPRSRSRSASAVVRSPSRCARPATTSSSPPASWCPRASSRAGDHFAAARYCAGATDEGVNTYNVLDVTLAPGVPAPDPSLERNFFTTSSCGLCGKASIDAVRTRSRWTGRRRRPHACPPTCSPPSPTGCASTRTCSTRPAGCTRPPCSTRRRRAARAARGRRPAQRGRQGGRLGADREGSCPLRRTVLMVSGRASFELAQKAVMAGIPVLAAVSAPSSLAVELADGVRA